MKENGSMTLAEARAMKGITPKTLILENLKSPGPGVKVFINGVMARYTTANGIKGLSMATVFGKVISTHFSPF